MKKIIIVLICLLAVFMVTPSARAQLLANNIDTCVFVTGVPAVANDSTRWFNLRAQYAYVYLVVTDTNSVVRADSIKAFGISYRKNGTDSAVYQINLRRVDTYNDQLVTSAPNSTVTYLLTDYYIDRLFLVLSNKQFVNAVQTKITIKEITRH
jgi:hypothetical protein